MMQNLAFRLSYVQKILLRGNKDRRMTMHNDRATKFLLWYIYVYTDWY